MNHLLMDLKTKGNYFSFHKRLEPWHFILLLYHKARTKTLTKVHTVYINLLQNRQVLIQIHSTSKRNLCRWNYVQNIHYFILVSLTLENLKFTSCTNMSPPRQILYVYYVFLQQQQHHQTLKNKNSNTLCLVLFECNVKVDLIFILTQLAQSSHT